MRRKFLLTGGLLFLISSMAFAEILISTYKVDGFASNNLEVGATVYITVSYRNDTGAKQVIQGAKFYADYDASLVDDIDDSSITDNLLANLTSKTNPDFTPAPGQFRYQRDAAGGTGLPVEIDATIPCFTIKFRLQQKDANAGAKTIISWLAPTADNVKLTVGANNIAGNVNAFQAADLQIGANPTFTGLNTVTDTQKGNTLVLDWGTNGVGATDLANGAATYYFGHDGTHNGAGLRYNIYRNLLPQPPVTVIAGAYNGYQKQNGPNSGIPGAGNEELSDCKEYNFIVRAQDDCTPKHNEEQNNSVISGKPHDYTPPGPASELSLQQGDTTIGLKWTNPNDPDFGGVIVVRKEGGQPAPVLVSASGDNDGTDYNVDPNVLLSDGSVVVYKGKAATFTDTGRTNGVKYYYNIYAYDVATEIDNGKGVQPRQQGRNYSAGIEGSLAPGVPPADVKNIRALSDPNTSDISLKWTAPILDNNGNLAPALASGYGGALAVYTTDYTKWNGITRYSADNNDPAYSSVDFPVSAQLPLTPIANAADAEISKTISGLIASNTYYFKVFAYNIVPDNDKSTRACANGVLVAALPKVGGAGTDATQIDLKKSDTLGVNQFRLTLDTSDPSKHFYYAKGKQLSANTVGELVKAINTLGGGVTALGWWNSNVNVQGGTTQAMQGYTFGANGVVLTSSAGTSDLADEILDNQLTYQVSVTKSVSFKLSISAQ